MTDLDDIDARAGEFVLGSLDRVERAAVERDRKTDSRLEQAIRAWEQRLAPLSDGVAPMPPPPDLLGRIERAIELPRAAKTSGANATALPAAPSAEIIALHSRVRRWRMATVGATALAATFAGVAVFRDRILPQQPQTFVAAFVANDQLPRFMLSVDLKTRELMIRPIGADRLQGKTYQLWILAEPLGPVPRSLGVLDDGSSSVQRKTLSDYDANILRTATFGVSIEEAGGSRSGKPAAGALHAKLVPTAI